MFESEVSERLGQPGVAVGLAGTTMGGEIMYVEATRMEGEGKLTLTGQLGDVMKESANLALNWVRSNSEKVNLYCVLLTLTILPCFSRNYWKIFQCISFHRRSLRTTFPSIVRPDANVKLQFWEPARARRQFENMAKLLAMHVRNQWNIDVRID